MNERPDESGDRNPSVIVNSVVLPIILSLASVVGATFVAVQVTLSVLETKFIYVERQVMSIQEIVKGLKIHEVKLAERAIWSTYVDREILSHDRRLRNIEEKNKKND